MATTLEIIRGIQQAVANSYDGAHDERFVDGEDLVKKIGLRREEGCAINATRAIDGYGVRLHGDSLIVMYHTEVLSKESHHPELVKEVEGRINDIVKYLKKEYKKIVCSGLSLGEASDIDIDVQCISRRRVSVRANQAFVIKGMDGVESVSVPSEDRLDKAIKDFLSQGGEKAKKPKNYTAKNETK